ncbi:hypothetical protein ACO2Q3_07110 [Caulobacter sp. KR2-114]|uniref:hypothetical protein n=1 Tax=Caulobacter sp. KR2-114 TaxID=3400912 RepID=UPI003C08FFD4
MTGRRSGAALSGAALLAAVAAVAIPNGRPASAMQLAARTCDVRLNVIDQDPAGLNVRAAPGGGVIGVLKARNAWVETHVVGQMGEWLRIDEAVLIDDDQPDGEKRLFKGDGYVHVSKLGFETLNPNGVVRALPGGRGAVVYRAPTDEAKIARAQVLGCDGAEVQVRVGAVTGWTRDFCSNQRTTCA